MAEPCVAQRREAEVEPEEAKLMEGRAAAMAEPCVGKRRRQRWSQRRPS
jgi:hypothetical protein